MRLFTPLPTRTVASLTVNNGKFSSTAHNGNGQWAYCIRTLGEGTETVINYAEVSGVQGAVTVDSGGKVTINDGIFSTYDLSGTGNNFHGLPYWPTDMRS